MKISIVSIVAAALLATTQVAADESDKPRPKPPVHTPEWTNPTTGDPGRASVAEDLQKIVVLCAQDHNSAAFKREWSAYVRKHKLSGAKLQQTIQRVVDEAFRHRQELGQQRGDRRLSSSWKSEAGKAMHDTAKAAINNVRA